MVLKDRDIFCLTGFLGTIKVWLNVKKQFKMEEKKGQKCYK